MDFVENTICFIEDFLEQLFVILNQALYAMFGLTLTPPDLGCDT